MQGEHSEHHGPRIRASLVLPEGLEAGLIGAFAVGVVYFARDVLVGEPLHTPSVLGTLLFYGVDAAREVRSAPGVAVAFHLIHFTVWAVAGFAGSTLMSVAEVRPGLRLLPLLLVLVWIFCVVALDGIVQHTGLVRPHLWLGGIAGAVAMGAFLLWRHPDVRASS